MSSLPTQQQVRRTNPPKNKKEIFEKGVDKPLFFMYNSLHRLIEEKKNEETVVEFVGKGTGREGISL